MKLEELRLENKHLKTKVSNTTVRIQEKSNHLFPKEYIGNRWFRCFEMCPVFRFHFILPQILHLINYLF
ncbi:hypothetical protein COC96_21740 [Bacillus cereus]|nr:hypothetical protein COC96_21740 [Bacillus cereus]